jgi:hypothetical protein
VGHVINETGGRTASRLHLVVEALPVVPVNVASNRALKDIDDDVTGRDRPRLKLRFRQATSAVSRSGAVKDLDSTGTPATSESAGTN